MSVGDMTYFMNARQDYLVREVVNDSDRTRVYSVSVVESAPPYGDAKTWKPKGGDLMYAPKQLVLRPGQSGWLRLYYKGKNDDTPRFFQVIYREERAVAMEVDAVAVKPRLSLQTVLVVQPRQPRQFHRLDGARLINDGNTVMLATARGACAIAQHCMTDRYLAPGESLELGEFEQKRESVRVVLANGAEMEEFEITW
ncbi:hypothetical protein WI26_25515 [Burkholderia diffusa]|nr:hypothetical protein WI26_25515 [Burkholderia diffusa]